MKISRRSMLLSASAAAATVTLPVKSVAVPASSFTSHELALEQIKAGVHRSVENIRLWLQETGQGYKLSGLCSGYDDYRYWDEVDVEDERELEEAITRAAHQVAAHCVKQCQDFDIKEVSEFHLEMMACGAFAIGVRQEAEEENLNAMKTLVRPLVEQAGITVVPSVHAA